MRLVLRGCGLDVYSSTLLYIGDSSGCVTTRNISPRILIMDGNGCVTTRNISSRILSSSSLPITSWIRCYWTVLYSRGHAIIVPSTFEMAYYFDALGASGLWVGRLSLPLSCYWTVPYFRGCAIIVSSLFEMVYFDALGAPWL